VYLLVLPKQEAFLDVSDDGWSEPATTAEYTPVPSADPEDVFPAPGRQELDMGHQSGKVSLSFEDKLTLVKPLLLRYMLPLCMCSLVFRYHG
jgi:battenin